jgi:phosphoribosyl 1,2-cyclic phosphate phosphodiesterase
VVDSLRKRFDYIFADNNRYPGAPAVKVNFVRKNEAFRIGDIRAIPVEAFHNRLPVFGYRLGDFAYLTDVKTISDEETEKIKGVKALTINALRKDPHHSHFNLEEALGFVEKVGPDRAYLTHISHNMGFHEEVEKELPDNVHLAYDNLSIIL